MLRPVTVGVQGGDDGPRTGSRDVPDRDILFFQTVQNTQVCASRDTPAAQGDSHFFHVYTLAKR